MYHAVNAKHGACALVAHPHITACRTATSCLEYNSFDSYSRGLLIVAFIRPWWSILTGLYWGARDVSMMRTNGCTTVLSERWLCMQQQVGPIVTIFYFCSSTVFASHSNPPPPLFPQVVCVTYLPLVGYTILLRDLLAPLVEVALDRTLDGAARNLMVSVLVVLVSVCFCVFPSAIPLSPCVLSYYSLEDEAVTCDYGAFLSHGSSGRDLRAGRCIFTARRWCRLYSSGTPIWQFCNTVSNF